ncbi:hypothetical protein BJ165DRAFT_1409599 [Panaeolus papilionaceus]|nr:hypothetical protein BJ165DRAFT_1409599 [Panaeolus papilionaceus]
MSMQLMIEDVFAEGLYPFGFYKWEKNQLHTTYQNDPIARFHVEVLPICWLTSARCGTWGRYFVKTGSREVSANRPEESGQQTVSFNLQPSSHSPPGTPSVPIARYMSPKYLPEIRQLFLLRRDGVPQYIGGKA